MRKRVPALLACLILVVPSAHAQSTQVATAPLNVAITVTSACTRFEVANIDFGSVTTQSETTVPTTVTVNCPDGTPFRVGFDLGRGGQSVRGMLPVDGTPYNVNNFVYYRLLNLSNQEVGDGQCGAGTNSGPALTGTGSGSDTAITFFARTEGAQYLGDPVLAQSYSDTVTVTLCI